jgi:hypothetical protein
MICEELGQIEWQGEQVYRTLAHNALASMMIIDQLMPLLPKDGEEINTQVKRLHAILDMATMVDPTLDHGDRRRGQESDHRRSLHRDSASSISPPGEHGRDRDEGNLCNVICNRDAHNQIENWHQE